MFRVALDERLQLRSGFLRLPDLQEFLCLTEDSVLRVLASEREDGETQQNRHEVGAASPPRSVDVSPPPAPSIKDCIQPAKPRLNQRANFQFPRRAKHQLLAIVKRPEVNAGVCLLFLLRITRFYRGGFKPQ